MNKIRKFKTLCLKNRKMKRANNQGTFIINFRFFKKIEDEIKEFGIQLEKISK